MAFTVASAIISYATRADHLLALSGIRLATVLILGIILWLLQTAQGRRWPRELGLLAVVVVSISIEALAAHTVGQRYEHGWLNVVILGAAVLMTWSPAWSAAASLIVVGLYVCGTLTSTGLVGGPEFLRDLGYLMASGMIAVTITAMHEGVRWRDFRTRRSLDRIQSDMHDREHRYRSLVETAGSAIIALAPDHRILEFNRGAERIHGCQREDVLGKDYLALFVPEQFQDAATALIKKVLASCDSTTGLEAPVLTRDGSTRILLWNNSCLCDSERRPIGLIAVGQDITERRQAEKRYRAIVEDQTELICRWLPDGTLTFVNEAYTRYFGQRRDELVGHSFLPLIPDEDRQMIQQYVAQLGPGNWVGTHEHHVVAGNGEIRWQQWTNRAILDPSGAVVEIQSVGQDITERKRAEDEVRELNARLEERVTTRTVELRESEERLRVILETTPVGVIMGGADGTPVDTNPAFQQLVGYAPDELQRMDPFDLIHPDGRQEIVAKVAELQDGKRNHLHLEWRYVRRDGRIVWADAAVTAVRDRLGKFRYAFAMVQDITERKLDEALERGERRALTLLAQRASLGDALTALIASVEEVAPEMLCSVLLADGEGHRLEHAAGPRLPAVYRRAVDGLEIGPRAGSCGTAAYRRERVVVEDVSIDPLWADYRQLALPHGLRACWSQPITSSAGRLLGTFAMYYGQPRGPVDTEVRVIEAVARVAGIIIERKQNADLLRRHQIELAHVGRVSLVGELASSLAHELHQPLAAITNYAGACIRRVRAGVTEPDEVIYQIERIRALSLRAGEVIRRLRSFIQKREPRKEQVDLNELVRSAASLAEPEAQRHAIALRLDLASPLPFVEVDSIQVEQVILNLVNNGLEAMTGSGGNGGELVIQSSVDPDGFVALAVRDMGKGLSPAIQSQLFAPFFTTKSAGLGMGLSICRSIVEAQGGRIWARANPEGGATFQFTLPCSGTHAPKGGQATRS
jgi:PAS domain S-box-containing protein